MWLVTLQPVVLDRPESAQRGERGKEEAARVAMSSASVLSLVTRFGGLAVVVGCVWILDLGCIVVVCLVC